jgi:predicted CXXCH cytochrome family protein
VKFAEFLLAAVMVAASAGYAAAQQGCVTAECHAGFTEKKTTHPADTACAACHLDSEEKHARGGEPPALQEKMCVSCHETILDHRYPHSPVTATTCHLCHDPHGDMGNMLLAAGYSTRQFVDYTPEAYKLCFSCHKRDLLMFPDTSYSTGFRNGTGNLHYRHVNKNSRGRSCKLCHGVHGAEQPHLMADAVSFGNWRMPVNFIKTENGGSCAPGCHEPRQYDRKATKQQGPAPAANAETEGKRQ